MKVYAIESIWSKVKGRTIVALKHDPTEQVLDITLEGNIHLVISSERSDYDEYVLEIRAETEDLEAGVFYARLGNSDQCPGLERS